MGDGGSGSWTKWKHLSAANLSRSATHRLARQLMGVEMLVGDEDKGVPDPPDIPVEESTEPRIGYRSWDVYECEGDYRLQSPIRGTEWTGPILRADGKPCTYDPHDPRWQGRDDHCHGIYAHDEPEWSDFDYSPMQAAIASNWMMTFKYNNHGAGIVQGGPETEPQWEPTKIKAMGRVELTGRVVVHEDGYRAEAARIAHLVLSPRGLQHDGMTDILAEKYQCDVSFDPTTLEES